MKDIDKNLSSLIGEYVSNYFYDKIFDYQDLSDNPGIKNLIFQNCS